MKSDKMPSVFLCWPWILDWKLDVCASNPEKASKKTQKNKQKKGRCQVYELLVIRKTSILILWKRLYEKVLYFFKRTYYKCN